MSVKITITCKTVKQAEDVLRAIVIHDDLKPLQLPHPRYPRKPKKRAKP